MMKTHTEGRLIQILGLANLTGLGLLLAIAEPAHAWEDKPGGDRAIAIQSISGAAATFL